MAKQRFEIVDPAALVAPTPQQDAQPSEVTTGDHVRKVEEVFAADCAYGECDHDIDENCPTWEVDSCAGCTTEALDREGDLAGVVRWPCPKSGGIGEGSDA